MPAQSDHDSRQRLDGRALIEGERRALGAIVASTALGTLAEAGFLVLVARAGVALASSSRRVTLFDETSVTIAIALAISGTLAVIRFGANIASARCISQTIARTTIRIRRAFTEAFLGTAWEIKHSLAPGRVQQLLSNYARSAVNVVAATARGLSAAMSLVALVVAAFSIQPYITLVAAVLVFVLGAAMQPLRRLVKRASREAADAQVAFGTRVNEIESMALEIDVHSVRSAAAARVDRNTIDAASALRRSQFAQLAIGPSYQLVTYSGIVGLLIVGANTGVDDIGTVGAVMVLLLRSLSYGQSFQIARAQYTQANVYATSLADEIDRYVESTPPVGDSIPIEVQGLSATQLDFAYDQTPTLHDVNFHVSPGSRVGVVGPSGGGKSTLAQLLLGLRQSGGALELDGVAIDEADPTWWRKQVALVPQHSNLLTGTVAENVRFLRPEISDVEIEKACRQAAIHDEIMEMGGYDTSVGERGGELSGGQQQRLCIARALAGRPQLLVLDEATSALDAVSERRILVALGQLDSDVIIIAVTHRPAVLDICDHVLHLDEGKVDFFGPIESYEHRPENVG